MATSTLTSCVNDDQFGPAVQGCRDDFDFTLKFEKILFSAVPASIFIVLATGRLFQLAHKPRLVFATPFQLIKIITIAVYVAFQLSLLILASTQDATPLRSSSVAGVALVFLAGLFMIALSFLEHARSRRTSALLNVYLLFTLVFDVIQARTLWLSSSTHQQNIITRLFTTSVAVKLVVLLFEAQGKTRWISNWDEKEHSPEEASGIYSLSVYYWLKQLFVRGFSGVIDFDDLYGLDRAISADVAGPKLSAKIKKGRSLLSSLFRAFAWELFLPVFPNLTFTAFQYSQTFFLEALIKYLEAPVQKNVGYGLIVACALIYFGMALSTSYKGYYTERSRSMARACLCAAIYQKTTEVSTADASDGASMTLMSTDVEHVEVGVELFHTMWNSLLKVGIGCYLLYGKLGVAFITPIITIIICTAALVWVMTLVQSYQATWMEKIQTRVGLTANTVANMKYFKMLGISDHVADHIQGLRQEEVRAGTRFRVLLGATFALATLPTTASPVLTFALTVRHLNVSTLFVSLSYLALLSGPLQSIFQGLPQCLAALTSLSRIETFLLKEPQQDRRQWDASNIDSSKTPETRQSLASESSGPSQKTMLSSKSQDEANNLPAYVIEDGSFSWEEGKEVLKNINLVIPRGKMSMIIGPIASGKSTLCKVLLGEIPHSSGTTHVKFPHNAVSYCAQTPFLSDASFQDNIVGHSRFDQKKYDSIIAATLLGSDVALLPLGHDTKIGSNGIILSGGQKQRVSLARALYHGAGVMIFDDVFSGLDANTESEIFRRVFGRGGFLRKQNITAIVCTHSVHHLPSADHIIALGANGTIVEQGSFNTLQSNGKYVSSLGVSGDDSDVEVATNEKENSGDAAPQQSSQASKNAEVDPSRQAGDWSVYIYYFSTMKRYALVIFLASGLMFGALENFSTIWISMWSADAYHRDKSFYVGLYGLIRAFELLTILVVVFVGLLVMVASSGLSLHKSAITTVVSAPLSLFTNTDTGTVTNLFSQDMTLIDGQLPMSLLNTYVNLTSLIGMLFVVAIASPYLAISYPFMLFILYGVQMFYLRTSRQLRLLDLEAKSPLYNHFLDTMSGLATIRAFGWVKDEILRNRDLLNASQQPAYLLRMIQQWLETNLSILVGCMAIGLTCLATQLRTSSAFTGASLLTLINLSVTIAGVMQSYTQLETSIGAINRLRTFSSTVKPEDEGDLDKEVPNAWPLKGNLYLRGVSASYSSSDAKSLENIEGEPSKSLAINNLSMSIQSGEKVAVCGRTGSGKSSLMLLLLRLLDPLTEQRDIEIDGIPLHTVNRNLLRKRLISVPQDSVFLPGTSSIKLNLDPLGTATDEDCRAVLETVQLVDFVKSCGGLHAQMSADSLSAGQQQLFGLGRAVLRRRMKERDSGASAGGVLLLDEMNSKLDKKTDKITQDIIRKEFEGYTVIMVVHRLDMVMSLCDRVFVLNKGSLVEEGRPKELAETKGSWFGELWRESG